MRVPTSPTAQPLVVVWRVTAVCDLSCWFCEYNRHLRRPRHTAPAADVLAFGQVLSDYAVASCRPILVSWIGGEPLVWPPLVEVGGEFKQRYGLELGITTNGWQLDRPGLIEHLAETYAEITISVDGPTDSHDKGRGAPGLFERLRVAVAELRARRAKLGHGPTLRANTILMRSTLPAFEALCHTLADWGIEAVTFNTLGGQPPSPYYERERLLPDDIAGLCAALPGLRQRLAGRGLQVLGHERYLGRLANQAGGVAVPVIDCHPGASFLFVDECGRVAPCSFTGDGYGVPLAELRTGADLAHLPARFTAQRGQARLPPCHDCLSTQVFGKFDLAETPG